jgi:two-component system CheB/CheR fusion protein
VRFTHEGRLETVRLGVQPLKRTSGKKQDLLVVFQKAVAGTAEGNIEEEKRGRGGKHPSAKTEGVQRELVSAREQLRSLIAEHETAQEEMKAANEEILSSNEELQSTNEELETAKEELQSANEELVTLNDELQHRNDELTVLTHDLSNLLVGVDIPVLVLDADLRVRRFTPVAGTLLNLIPGDVGRPFSDIASTLDVGDWSELFAEVTTEGRLIDREVNDRKGHRYSLRVRPYKTSDGKIEGVLVVMLDTDLIYQARDAAKKSGDYSRAIVDTVHEALAVVDSQFRVVSVNESFGRLFNVPLQEAKGKEFFGPGPVQCDMPELKSILQDVLAKNTVVKNFEIKRNFPRAGRRRLVFNARQIDNSGTILIAMDDITERKQAQEHELRILRAFVDRAPIGVIMLDRRMQAIQVSQRWLDDVGMTRDQVVGRNHYDCFPNLPQHWEELFRRGLAGESLSGREENYFTPDGKKHCVDWQIAPWGDVGATTGGILISSHDVTN